MLKLLFLKNKKSAIEVSLIHLLEIILAIGVVLLLIYLSLKLSGLFMGRQEYDSAINNLEALSLRVKELVKDSKDTSSQTMVYTIPNNYILVGFSYDNKGAIRTECTKENIVNAKSRLCQTKSCLCIYQNFGNIANWQGKDFDAKGDVTALKCKPFDEKIIFLTPTFDSNFQGAQTQWRMGNGPSASYYLVLYGQCGLGASWGIRQISMDKYKEGENLFISIKENSKRI